MLLLLCKTGARAWPPYFKMCQQRCQASTLGDPPAQSKNTNSPSTARLWFLSISVSFVKVPAQSSFEVSARRHLLGWTEAGDLTISISRRFPLAEAAEAHRLLESQGSIGKVVLMPVGG